MRIFLSLILMAGNMISPGQASRPKAMVYRGPASCEGCPEAVASLLRSSPSNFDVVFAGPSEAIDINEVSLQGVQLYAQPGGGGGSFHWVVHCSRFHSGMIHS